ncbi:MAG: hypothetical protein AAF702_44070 [Chloroflexota bacterium]
MHRQLAKGEAAETLLDGHFSDRFKIRPATREEQRLGIDRYFTQFTTGKTYTIEYKTDWTASRTGNAFVETVSVDTMNIPGWIYTSQAEWLIYYVPGRQVIYIGRLSALQEMIEEWVERFGPEKAIPNDGYFTQGILVPLEEFGRQAVKIETLNAIPQY